MKTLSLLILSASALFAQATINVQAIPSEANVPVTVSAEAVTAITQFAISIAAPGVPSTTLASAITANSTSIAGNLASTTGMAAGMGLRIDNEIMLINPNLSVTRGTFGTTPAVHSTGAVVTVLRSGNYSEFFANVWADTIRNAILISPGPLVTAQQTATANAQATIVALQANAVTHQ